MSLADRIAVLDQGELKQLGTAREMYYTPSSEFVAKLFGEPEINILPAHYAVEDGQGWITLLHDVRYQVPPDVAKAMEEASFHEVDVALRGNDIAFSFEKTEGWIPGTVYANEPIGNKVIMTVAVGGSHVRLVAPNDTQARMDSDVFIRPNLDNMLYFDRASQRFITRHNIEGVLAYHRGGQGKGGAA